MENVLQQSKIKVKGTTLTEREDRKIMSKAAVKLPKIEIKCFYGDYIYRKLFKETLNLKQQFTREQI